MFRVIIAGGRDFSDYDFLARTMDRLLYEVTDDITVVCGMARGADSLGEKYATEKNYAIDYHQAEWSQFGRGAGYRRNIKMAECSDALVAFWDGDSKGTKHMIETAQKHGLKTRVIRYDKRKDL